MRLRSRDRDVCNRAMVRQRFAGNVIVAPHRDSWIIVKFQMRKTAGRTPRLSKSECAPPPSRPPRQNDPSAGPPSGCHPSYTPCVPSGRGDLDCDDIGGSVRVIGPDEYRLDSDSDGVGCED